MFTLKKKNYFASLVYNLQFLPPTGANTNSADVDGGPSGEYADTGKRIPLVPAEIFQFRNGASSLFIKFRLIISSLFCQDG